MKVTRSNENCEARGDGEGNSVKSAEQPAKPAEPPKDYIHVRARRGQATDSHSLAERVIWLIYSLLSQVSILDCCWNSFDMI